MRRFWNVAGEPPKQLRGFAKVALRAGESKQVTVTLDPHASSIWNTEDKGWVAVPGLYTVFVGDSSRDLPLHGTIIVGH